MKRYVLAIFSAVCLATPASASWGYCSAEGVGRKVLYISAVFDSDYFGDAGMRTGYLRFLESEGVKTGPAACASGQDQLAAIMIRNRAIDDALKIGVSVQPFGPF
ncbi:MAG: hypothetical protein JO223_16115 [Hyphomicrobiales bacterium]|nr:hypothetical protein [Hyphomicrobiales bacterium]MBV8439876.1 hypothetical protein [Hyphomicrobiales bacterium]